MAEAISWRAVDVFMMEVEANRELQFAGIEARLEIEFEVTRSGYTLGTPRVIVECEYDVQINRTGDPFERLGHLRARAAVVMDGSRPIEDVDPESGTLESAKDYAHKIAHPYMRAQLRQLANSMSIPALPFPIDFEETLVLLDGADSQPDA